MDPFKMGLRNLIGITAPGAIVLLALTYGLFGVALVLEASSPLVQLKDAQWFLVIAALLLSYLLGNIFRLNSADNLDALSSRQMERGCFSGRNQINLDEFLDLRRAILEDPAQLESCLKEVPDGFDHWLWSTELFPYPAWSLRKLSLYHPGNVVRFFETYRDVMKRLLDLDSRKEFFNYCKMVVAARVKKQEDALVQEVQSAEANVRFFAGTYFALELSSVLIVLVQLWLVTIIGTRSGYPVAAITICIGAAAFGLWERWPRAVPPVAYLNSVHIQQERSDRLVSPEDATGTKESELGHPQRLEAPIASIPVPKAATTISKAETRRARFLQNLEKREQEYAKHARVWAFSYALYAVGALGLLLLWMRDGTSSGPKLALFTRAASMLLITFAIIRLMDRGCQLIVDRFRLLRIKEVDIVLEAFYLAQPAPDVDTTEPTVAPIA